MQLNDIFFNFFFFLNNGSLSIILLSKSPVSNHLPGAAPTPHPPLLSSWYVRQATASWQNLRCSGLAERGVSGQ